MLEQHNHFLLDIAAEPDAVSVSVHYLENVSSLGFGTI